MGKSYWCVSFLLDIHSYPLYMHAQLFSGVRLNP